MQTFWLVDMERLPLKSEVIKDTVKEVPPYTGFGSEEDSLTSSQGLEPRAPQPDFFKFMHKDRSNFLLLTYLLNTCGLCKAYKFYIFLGKALTVTSFGLALAWWWRGRLTHTESSSSPTTSQTTPFWSLKKGNRIRAGRVGDSSQGKL